MVFKQVPITKTAKKNPDRLPLHILFIYLKSYCSICASISICRFQQQKKQTSPFHPEMTDDRDIEQCCAQAPPSPLSTISVSEAGEFWISIDTSLWTACQASLLSPPSFVLLLSFFVDPLYSLIVFVSPLSLLHFFHLCSYLNFFQQRWDICFSFLLIFCSLSFYSFCQQNCTAAHK